MIICEVNKNHLNVRTRELLTVGSQKVNTVEFRFNEAWDGLAKTATFKTSKKTISVLLNTNTTAIPWEALADAGEILAVGVFGVSGETIVLPTVWGILGKVMDAAHLGDEEKEPTPDVYQKILDELNALERPTWTTVQNKPFESLGGGLSVDENGVLSAEGGTGGSANAVQYVAQTLTDEQKAQARENIGASPIPTVRYWLDLKADNIINLYNMGVGYGIISPVDYDQTVPTGMSSPMLVIFGRMNYGIVDITVYDGAGAVWWGSLNLSSQTTDVTKTGDYVTNTALTDILQNYVPAENYEENLQEIAQAIGTKLDKNQGVGNAGKILGIGEDGNVVPQDKPTYTLTDADKTAVAEEVVADGIAATLTDMPSGGAGAWEELIDTTIEAGEGITAISLNLPKSDIAKGYACQLEFTKSTGDAWGGSANMTPRINGALMGYFLFNDDLSKNSINYFAIGNFESLGNGYIDFAKHVYSLKNNLSNVARQLGANRFIANVTGKFEMGFAGKTYIGTAKIKVWGRYK